MNPFDKIRFRRSTSNLLRFRVMTCVWLTLAALDLCSVISIVARWHGPSWMKT
jgi:hypothetical protein